MGRLKSEVSRLQARLVGSVSRVEHVKAIKEREDVIASMVSAEEVPSFTFKLQPKRTLGFGGEGLGGAVHYLQIPTKASIVEHNVSRGVAPSASKP